LAALDVLTADPGTHLHRTHLHRTCGASQVQVCSALQVQVCVRGKWTAENAEILEKAPRSQRSPR